MSRARGAAGNSPAILPGCLRAPAQILDPNVAIVFHDSFRPLAWKKFMQAPAFNNVILDTHLYQCFSERQIPHGAGTTAFAINRKEALDEMQREELPTIVGEWSLALPGQAMIGLSPFQIASVNTRLRRHATFELRGDPRLVFLELQTSTASGWNFRYCVERGWLPGNFAV